MADLACQLAVITELRVNSLAVASGTDTPWQILRVTSLPADVVGADATE